MKVNDIKRMIPFAFFLTLFILVFGWFCPIYWITGIPCPGCGFTRGSLSLLSLDIEKSWYFSPSVILSLGWLCFLPFFKNQVEKWLWGLAILLFLVWIVRMFLVFPQDPMSLNTQAIFPQIIGFLGG